MMTTNLFVIVNVKQLRTDGSFRILLPLFRTSWCVGVLNSAIFNRFHNRVEFGTILEGLWHFGGGLTPPRYATGCIIIKYAHITNCGHSDTILVCLLSYYPNISCINE